MYLGIDLGTSNSAVVVMKDGDTRIIKTPEGTDTMPSVIYRDRRGHQTVGVRAYDHGMLSPDNVVEGFKRLIGTDTPMRFATSGVTITPAQASTEILRTLVGHAMVETGASAISGTVVTIPAAFNQMQCEATLAAARAAGLERVALLQEPVAAALAAMAGAQSRSGLFLVYDFGGGTFDAALVHAIDGEVTVLAHEGVNMLGGRDLDRAIVEQIALPWLRKTFSLPADFSVQPRYQRLVRIAGRAAELAKMALSSRDKTVLSASDDEVRLEDLSGESIYIDLPISRAELEKLGTDPVTRSVDCCRKMLAEVGYRNEDISRVVLIGGPTKMPFLRRRVQEELRIELEDAVRVDPMTAVAKGAAIYCEGRDWTAAGSSAKAARRTESAGQRLAVSFEYDARTASERAVLQMRQTQGPSGAEVLVDSSFGWSSQRRPLSETVKLDLPLHDIGPNTFRITVFGEDGMPVRDVSREIVIDRLLASTAGIPASQSIAAKILNDQGENKLDVIIHKGTPLPAKGAMRYRLAAPLRAGDSGQIHIELYQVGNEGLLDPGLNLMVGEFSIDAADLPTSSTLRRGDEVILHWAMTESQEIIAEIELPTASQRFTRRKFYNWQIGLQNFAGPEGAQVVAAHLEQGKNDLEQAEEVLPFTNIAPLGEIRRYLDHWATLLESSDDAELRRRVSEDVRLIRQQIALLCQRPEVRQSLLLRHLRSAVQFYGRNVRADASRGQVAQIDSLTAQANAAIERGGASDLDLASDLIAQIDRLHWEHGFAQTKFCIECYKFNRDKRFLAGHPKTFDRLVAEGDRALAVKDHVTLRDVLFEILADQRNLGPNARMPERAWLMRL
jgi:molecular chaperone DnaK